MAAMFFCFGSPRSGTTLISQSLSAHPNIIVPGETDFIIPTAFLWDRIKAPTARIAPIYAMITNTEYYPHSLAHYLTAAEIHDHLSRHADDLSSFLEAIYGAIAVKAGAQIAGDKSPNDMGFAAILKKTDAISPTTKVIHIVRDVRDALAALVARKMSPRAEATFGRSWSTSNVNLADWLSDHETYMRVRYEDFVADPESEMRRILAFLGQPFDAITLDPERRPRTFYGSPIHDMLYQPTSTARVGSYRSVLSAEAIVRCEQQAAEGMQRFGYALS